MNDYQIRGAQKDTYHANDFHQYESGLPPAELSAWFLLIRINNSRHVDMLKPQVNGEKDHSQS